MVKVSVIIPAYNYGHFVGESVRSVLNQTFTDFELIVVDDGSTDDTAQIISAFNDHRIRYIYQKHQGVGAAQNCGIMNAKGEYITILGSDDIYLPDNLDIKVKYLDSHASVGLVCSDAYVFDNNTGAILGRFWRDPKVSHFWVDPERAAREPLRELLYRGCFIMPQATMVRREVFKDIGYFDESLPTHEDWDLFLRMILRYRVEIIDKPLLKLRRHTSNLSENQDKMYFGAVGAINKAMKCSSLSREELKLLKNRLSPQHFRFARQSLLKGQVSVAREALIAGIKLDPCNIKLYVHLVLSLLGSRRFLALRGWKNGLGNLIFRRQISRNKQSVSN
jgi:glycosyltransferase involved in cell wall biosynthesis